MSDREPTDAEFLRLVDAYCAGPIDPEGLRRLERALRDDGARRRAFVAYFQLHTELTFSVRAGLAADAVLGRIDPGKEPSRPGSRTRPWSWPRPGRLVWPAALAAGVLIAAAGLLAAGVAAWRAGPDRAGAGPANVAWLVNAQDCVWAGASSEMPGRNMGAGKVLRLRRGLAEVEFERGARVILRGPAVLELRSANEGRLLYGSLTAKVPPRARGFTMVAPGGTVVDLGTEFGLAVDERGATDLDVFDGMVEAFPRVAAGAGSGGVRLLEDQHARLDGRRVSVGQAADPGRYVRAIVPPPVVEARTAVLDFTRAVEGTLADADGLGVGLTHRLPGTGAALPGLDPNLRLDTARGLLHISTTRSDINTQLNMDTGEYFGIRLADLGFTGPDDFAFSATIADIPGLDDVGQFGLYVGARSDRNIRGGLISPPEPDRYEAFLVNNDGGIDADLNMVGLLTTGDDLRLTLRRLGGRYSLVVENLTRGSSNTLSIPHPEFLDREHDLHAGLFAANPRSDVRRPITVTEVRATVWTVTPRDASQPAPTLSSDPAPATEQGGGPAY